MKLSQLYLQTRRALMLREDEQTASLYARDLLCHVTGKTKEEYLRDREMYVSDDVCAKLEGMVARIQAGTPLAYVLGAWEFYGLPLIVTPDVLIPRDDTCAVTELSIRYARELGGPCRILDLCTGSGCIGLAVASNVENSRVTLADISPEALAVAKKNIALNKLSARVSCVAADALRGPDAFLGKFDLIVSNPPYITSGEMQELPCSVKDHEPHLALWGGDDGLDFYRSIAEKYKYALKPGGYLCFEFGMGQGNDVCQILEDHGYTILEKSRDYNTILRAVIARYGRKEDQYGYKENSL